MAKPEMSREYFSEPNEQNNKWLNEFIQNLKESGKYNVERFKILHDFFSFKEFTSISINEMTITDVKKYIDIFEKSGYKPKSIVKILSNLSALITFLHKKNNIDLDFRFQAEINELKNSYSERSKPKGVIFDIKQLYMIREYNKKDDKANYFFELVFQTGLQKEDIKFCNKNYLNRENCSFEKPDGSVIPISPMIMEILDNNPDDFEVTDDMSNKYLERITKNLIQEGNFYKDTNLNMFDIRETSKDFFLECPNCKRRLENVSRNWVLAKTDYDDDFRLVCCICKGEPQK